MFLKLYLVYFCWAMFVFFGGWCVTPSCNFRTGATSLFNDICWACWGNIIGLMLSLGTPLLFALQVIILIKLAQWIRIQLDI